MSSWSSRRKSLYALIVVVILVGLIGIPVYKFFYVAPTCSDGLKNGDEQGIDCGGSCKKLCSNTFLDIPSPSWIRFKEVAPKIYNVAAYMVNPNPRVGISNKAYRLKIFDKNGFDVVTRSGKFSLAPGRNTLIFIGGLEIVDRVPARATLEFVKQPEWVPGADPLSGLDIVGKDYRESTTESSLDVTLNNRTAKIMRDVVVYAILKDKDNNVIDFSKTIVDQVAPQDKALAPFTWPVSHDGQVISLEVLAVPE